MIANPIYGGAYAYGKSRSVTGYDGRSAIRRKARDEWLALIPDAHEGYVSWERAEEIRKMVGDNVPTSRHHGAPKHGDALLAGLFRCKRCGRKRQSGTPEAIITFRAIPAGVVCSTMASHAALLSVACGSMTRSKRHCSARSNQAPLPPPSRRTVIWPANATRSGCPSARPRGGALCRRPGIPTIRRS
ncbi:hypothetical protein GOB44_27335 [Sinorhizobium meliloti]|nr:hypothetical protein [Sinorhizobium meliloti]MDW9713538.1 hypothetical protein [Sinorhizobium meliloti]MDW9750619.1 hypothetical protein [Sinorhizobium meliloti]MDX0252291.1 hypothetical protein [Sinorhizobium meliloti]MDX0359605.1 hypothetical protein [Sinorhizobium meliloti]